MKLPDNAARRRDYYAYAANGTVVRYYFLDRTFERLNESDSREYLADAIIRYVRA